MAAKPKPTVSYAMPIPPIPPPGSGHADYTPFASVVQGKQFRQPVTFDHVTDNVPGLELVMDDNEAIAKLYALVNGTLSYHVATSTTPAELVLDFQSSDVNFPLD